jgi:hypothetical protein
MARAGAAAAAGAGRPVLARPLPGRLPCRWPVVVLASGRPPRVPLSLDLVPPLPGLAGAPGLRAAIYSPLFTAVTAAEEQTLAGWLFVIWQMAPVM